MSEIVFGLEGWRALFAEKFTFANVRIVTQAIANYIKRSSLDKKTLLIAYDQRFMSKQFALECARVTVGNGIRTVMLKNVLPEAAVALAVSKLAAAGAIIITAGEMSAQYNGLKFIPSYSGPILQENAEQIQQEIDALLDNTTKVYELDISEAADFGIFSEMDFAEEYKQQLGKMLHLISPPDLGDPVKVVLDLKFGSVIGYLDKLLVDIGCSVQTINNYRDPLFGEALPSVSPLSLDDLKNAVLSNKAHIGLALDATGTSFAIIDAEGNYISSGEFAVYLFYHWLDTRVARGPICRTLSATHMLDKIARLEGLSIIETPDNFSLVSEKMRENTGLMGVAESGQLALLGHIPYPDAVLACILAVEILLVHRGYTLADLKTEIIAKYGWQFEETIKFALDNYKYRQLLGLLSDFNPITIADIRVNSSVFYAEVQSKKISLADDSCILIKMYPTDESLKIYMAASSKEQSAHLREELLSKLELIDLKPVSQ